MCRPPRRRIFHDRYSLLYRLGRALRLYVLSLGASLSRYCVRLPANGGSFARATRNKITREKIDGHPLALYDTVSKLRPAGGLFHGPILQLTFATWRALYLRGFFEWCKTYPF